ncbi:MAG: hypothetical protein H0Z28_04340 [Archaeoglobus sp.]|nr:hypothetical protein [Archaeoglobus sp.]
MGRGKGYLVTMVRVTNHPKPQAVNPPLVAEWSTSAKAIAHCNPTKTRVGV